MDIFAHYNLFHSKHSFMTCFGNGFIVEFTFMIPDENRDNNERWNKEMIFYAEYIECLKIICIFVKILYLWW